MDIKVNITNKRCTVQGAPVIVCGNSDYTITFTFDEEWAQAGEKTARFSYVRDGELKFRDVKLKDNTAAVPPVYRTRVLRVGVYAGDLATSTPARIPCEKSAVCDTCTPEELWPGQAETLRRELERLDQTKADLDDTVVGAGAWSSKNTIDQLCPAFTESGTVVQCEPVAGYPLEVIAKETATVTQCGKNLYNAAAYPLKAGFYINLNKGTIHNPSGDNNYAATVKDYYTPLYVPVGHLVGQIITLNNTPGGTSPGMAFFDSDKTFISGGKGKAITVPNGAEYMAFCVDADKATDVQIELGSVATGYEEYSKETLSLTVENGYTGTASGFKGINTLFADSSVEITVTGKADPGAIIDKLTSAIIALGGNI